jgi:hypothetical protein
MGYLKLAAVLWADTANRFMNLWPIDALNPLLKATVVFGPATCNQPRFVDIYEVRLEPEKVIQTCNNLYHKCSANTTPFSSIFFTTVTFHRKLSCALTLARTRLRFPSRIPALIFISRLVIEGGEASCMSRKGIGWGINR